MLPVHTAPPAGQMQPQDVPPRPHWLSDVLMWVWVFPQIIAVALAFAVYGDEPSCSRPIRAWLACHGVIAISHLAVNSALIPFRDQLASPGPAATRLLRFKVYVDVAALFSYCFGTATVFARSDCAKLAPHTDAIAYWLFIVASIRMFLPCICAILLVPLLCCCLPCLVRWAERHHDPNVGKGASQEQIDGIGTEQWRPEPARPSDVEGGATDDSEAPACPVCLVDFEEGEHVRRLPCAHVFHKDCIDDWLRVNATCPTCRAVVIRTPGIVAAQQREQQQLRSTTASQPGPGTAEPDRPTLAIRGRTALLRRINHAYQPLESADGNV